MALREVRVDDVTGDPGAVPVTFTVEGVTWTLDLATSGQKLLADALQPFIDAAVRVEYTATSLSADAAHVHVEAAELNADDRRACRAWANGRDAKKAGVEAPAARGKIAVEVVEAWINAGRPGAVTR